MNTQHTAQFYFANLGADVIRCVSAAKQENEDLYHESYQRAEHTLSFLKEAGDQSAYKEGMLMLNGLEVSRQSDSLDAYATQVNNIIATHAAVMG